MSKPQKVRLQEKSAGPQSTPITLEHPERLLLILAELIGKWDADHELKGTAPQIFQKLCSHPQYGGQAKKMLENPKTTELYASCLAKSGDSRVSCRPNHNGNRYTIRRQINSVAKELVPLSIAVDNTAALEVCWPVAAFKELLLGPQGIEHTLNQPKLGKETGK